MAGGAEDAGDADELGEGEAELAVAEETGGTGAAEEMADIEASAGKEDDNEAIEETEAVEESEIWDNACAAELLDADALLDSDG